MPDLILIHVTFNCCSAKNESTKNRDMRVYNSCHGLMAVTEINGQNAQLFTEKPHDTPY